jgi:hypothetical protein
MYSRCRISWWGWGLCERTCAKLGHVSMVCDGFLFIPHMEHSLFWFLINLLSLVVTFMNLLNIWSHWTLDISGFYQSSNDLASSLYHTTIFSLNFSIFGDSFFIFWFFFCLLIFGIFFMYHILSFFHYFFNFRVSLLIFWFFLLVNLLSFIQFFWFYMACKYKTIYTYTFLHSM